MLNASYVEIHRHWSAQTGVSHQVQLPDAVVLGDGQGADGAIKASAGAGDQPLIHQQCQVFQPDARHLVHRDQSSLVGVIQSLQSAMGGGQASYLLPALCQVG